MHKKPLISAIITVLFMSILFWYSLVFGETGSYSGPVKIDYISGKNIYTSDFELNQTRILFRSGVDLSENKIISSCDTYSKMKYKKKDLYYFELKYFSPCNDNKISLVDKNGNELYSWNLEITTEYDLYNKFVDYSSDDIKNIQQFLSNKILKLGKQQLSSNVLERAKQQREHKEAQYMQNFLQQLLKQREEKYLVPVAGYNISDEHNRIPNSGRPYRSSYTDGIHHWWDVGSKFGENVRALDNGMIIRVISDFEYEDLDQLNLSNNLTDQDKLTNLDILRWNQIWLKTSRWDVVFYSHLEDVSTHVKEWMMVRKGETIWTIGSSGVPEKGYDDYHLHFAIQKNPYNKTKNQEYSYLDYMKWDWYFKWQSQSEVLKYQNDIFKYEY